MRNDCAVRRVPDRMSDAPSREAAPDQSGSGKGTQASSLVAGKNEALVFGGVFVPELCGLTVERT
jgi:hypothetical protein